MTEQEAIKYLKDGWVGSCYQSAKLMAIEALEKQIPKKPTNLVSKLLIGQGWTYKCPTCLSACGENRYHPEVTCDDVYCSQCGQKLDWSN